MKHKISFLSAILLGLFITFSFAANDWQLFEEKDFQALFPQKPMHSIRKITTEMGEQNMDIYMYDASKDKTGTDDNLAYGVLRSAYPETKINSDFKDQRQAFFRKAIDGAVEGVKGKLLSEKEIALDGYPGREIRISFKDGLAIIKMQVFLVKNVVYMVQTISLAEKEENLSVAKFMNAFKLKP